MLNQPYPTSQKSPVGLLLTGLIPGVLLASVLIVFQPFGTDTVNFPGKTAFLAGYGVIVAVTFWLIDLIPIRFFDSDRWTVGKQILLVLIGTFAAITASYSYVLQLGGSVDWAGYQIFVANAMLLSTVPIVGATLIDFHLKFRKYNDGARAFNVREKTETVAKSTTEPFAPTPTQFIVKDDQDRAVFTLSPNRIWCLRSDRNYVDIFHLNADNEPIKTTVRNTLTKLAVDLPENFLRCHRSYVVNTDWVDDVSGNAQGYRLHYAIFPDVPVPISRGKSKEILGSIGK